MKSTSVRVFLLIVLCLALIPIRQSQKVAAAPAIDDGGTSQASGQVLTGNCIASLFPVGCVIGADSRDCPFGKPVIKPGVVACSRSQYMQVDIGRVCYVLVAHKFFKGGCQFH